jgi:ketosteroid isomerase-like protein
VTTTDLTPEQIVERNSRVVDQHFHSEAQEDVDATIALYAPDVVWESPTRGICCRTHEEVKANYLRLWRSARVRSFTNLRRQVGEDWAFDDTVVVADLVGEVESNIPGCPLPSGTRVSLRLAHYFEFDGDGGITREIAYESWRHADLPGSDDIPADATTISFE